MATLHELIEANHNEILHCWQEEASKTASARGLTEPQFQNLMSKFLATLCDAEDSAVSADHAFKLVEHHLSTRVRQGFDLQEIVDEFSILGRCITRAWDKHSPMLRPAGKDVERLLQQVNDAIAAATKLFDEYLKLGEQDAKRYLRIIRILSAEGLRRAAPWQEVAREMLQVIMEAAAAQTAAFLCYDPQSERLVMTATVGEASEVLHRYVKAFDFASFVGQVAASDEPVEVPDLTTTSLELSSALSESGIRSLLGVRLAPQHDLQGVLYIGTTENRAFSSREVRRLETLAESFALHLDNARLYTALQSRVEQLESERKLRERFVSILAHDIRTPLAAARMNAELLLRRSCGEGIGREATYMQGIVRNVDRAARMISDLLDVSHFDAGQRPALHIAKFDMVDLAQRIATELSAAFGDRFEMHSDTAVEGHWSADEIQRALWNLAENAVKYGEPNSPINIGVRVGGRGVLLSVHNEGEPIKEQDQIALFDLFARTSSAHCGGQQGWGLGLAMVEGCAEAHGGKVTLTSCPDTGTIFLMDLPLDARESQTTKNSVH